MEGGLEIRNGFPDPLPSKYYKLLAPSMAPQLSLTIRLHSRIWE